MNRSTSAVLLLAGGIAAAAPAPLPKSERPDTRPDLLKMQGEWVVVSEEQRFGYFTTLKWSAGGRVTVTGDWLRGRWLFGHRSIRLHLKPRSRAIDLHFDGDTDATFVGIYQVMGDTLTLCFVPSHKRRPSSFDVDQAEPGVYLVVLRRQK